MAESGQMAKRPSATGAGGSNAISGILAGFALRHGFCGIFGVDRSICPGGKAAGQGADAVSADLLAHGVWQSGQERQGFTGFAFGIGSPIIIKVKVFLGT